MEQCFQDLELFSKLWAFFGYRLYCGTEDLAVPKWGPNFGNYPFAFGALDMNRGRSLHPRLARTFLLMGKPVTTQLVAEDLGTVVAR